MAEKKVIFVAFAIATLKKTMFIVIYTIFFGDNFGLSKFRHEWFQGTLLMNQVKQ
jgi:hypothetical protein